MGVERAVTRWYVQRQSLLLEIVLLESQLEQDPSVRNEQVSGAEAVKEGHMTEVSQQLKRAQEKLRLLGPCPKPMMG